MAAARTLWFSGQVKCGTTGNLCHDRPWYRQKVAPSQLDVVWTCREALYDTGIVPIPRFIPDLAENDEEPPWILYRVLSGSDRPGQPSVDTYALSPLKGLHCDFETIAEQSHVHILRRIQSLGDTEDDVFVILEDMVAAEASHGFHILGLDPGIGA